MLKGKQLFHYWGRGLWFEHTPGALAATHDVSAVMAGQTPGGTNLQTGVMTTVTADSDNKVYIRNVSGEAIYYNDGSASPGDDNFHQIYARITEVAGVWTLTYYYRDDSGVQQAASNTANWSNFTAATTMRFRVVTSSEFVDVKAIDAVDNFEGIDEINPSTNYRNEYIRNYFHANSQALAASVDAPGEWNVTPDNAAVGVAQLMTFFLDVEPIFDTLKLYINGVLEDKSILHASFTYNTSTNILEITWEASALYTINTAGNPAGSRDDITLTFESYE